MNSSEYSSCSGEASSIVLNGGRLSEGREFHIIHGFMEGCPQGQRRAWDTVRCAAESRQRNAKKASIYLMA